MRYTAEDLARQIEELTRRVEALERFAHFAEPREPASPVPLAPPLLALPDTARLAPLVGLSFLGLAFAFLLRALAERNALPVAAGVGLGILYAACWLALAARSKAGATGVTTIRSLTAVLILMPLLWEALLRFHALSSWIVAALLVLFPVFGLAVAWRRNLAPVAWITTLAGLLVSVALLVVTKDLLPFILALLGLAVAVEASACFEHWLRERWLVALVVDLAVLLLTFVATRPAGWPEDYVPVDRLAVIGVQMGLLGVYLTSTFARTLWRRFTITGFETAQCVVAFLLCLWGVLRVAEGHPAVVLTAGAVVTFSAALNYTVSFAFVSHQRGNRNFYVYTSFGLMLGLLGTRLLLSGSPLVALWTLLAVVAMGAGRGAERLTLRWHGVIYLLLAAATGGFASQIADRYFTDAHPRGGPAEWSFWVFTTGAVLCLLTIRHTVARALTAVVTFIAGSAVAGALAILAAPLCSRSGADACPTVLTGVLVLLTLSCAWAAAQLGRRELAWTGYLFLALAACKLLVQDLRQAETLGLVVSLLLFGGTLVLLPRINARRAAG